MHITHVKIRNWRNFQEIEFDLTPTVNYVIGANASGKSNLHDVFRFLYDISKPEGGGLQSAVKQRGGVSKLRCLHATKITDVSIGLTLEDREGNTPIAWQYQLDFNVERTGAHQILIKKEWVKKNNEILLNRPDKQDKSDPRLLTETHLEQTRANASFRKLSEYFQEISYLHLVPQLLKYSDKIGGNRLENDPYGQGFLERIARTPQKTRDSRLNKMQNALSIAVPNLAELHFMKDDLGRPHLEAIYTHFRPNGAKQNEESFSDGTLRLLAIIWSLLDGSGLLLLEEPELSLNQAIIEQIPALINAIQNKSKSRRQIIISTHSEALLGNEAIDIDSIIRLRVEKLGTIIDPASQPEKDAIKAGFPPSQVLLPKTRPKNAAQLSLEF